jgi:hypothetical protein
MCRKSIGILLTTVLLSLSSAALAATHYVPDDFATIQAALDGAAEGDVVIVRDGTYTGAGNKNLDFNGKAIYLRSEHGPQTCTIDCQSDGRGFFFHSGETSSSVVDGFHITNGLVTSDAGAIYCYASSPEITNCIITGNSATGTWSDGGGIFCDTASPVISNCVITGNFAEFDGGGIHCYYESAPTITNCILTGNHAGQYGGGVSSWNAWPTVANCTVSGNHADGAGGGISAHLSSSATVSDSIVWVNSAPTGYELAAALLSSISVSYSDVRGGQAGAYVEAFSLLEWGTGNMDANPLFVSGPLGAYYLSQTSAGQASTSPCVNAGSDSAADLELDMLTTRTDHVFDADTADMGYHYGSATNVSRINLISPFRLSSLSSPPTFTWRTLGGTDNAFAVDASLSPGFRKHWSTYNDLHEVIQTESWTMPLPVWNMIPSGTRVYWRVRGADLAEEPLSVIDSSQIWSFIKQ